MWCNALRNITAEDIVEAAKRVMELGEKQHEEKK
jgi:hypothetical protein